VDGQLFNCAAICSAGKVLGVVPKTYLPNYKEFYDARYYSPATNSVSREIVVCGQVVPFGTDLLFACEELPDFILGVEICEDLWAPVPPSTLQSIAGATVLAKSSYRRQLIGCQSGRCIAGYVYASAGISESTTDIVFGGHCVIAENGSILAESPRFRNGGHLLVCDLDLDRLRHDRIQTNSFNDSRRNFASDREFRQVSYSLAPSPRTPVLERVVDAHPFVPQGAATLRERCDEIFHTQVTGLARRLAHIHNHGVAIGVSGGLDSTLALLVVCKTMTQLGVPRDRVKALTMPGFGTTSKTKTNAHALMRALGVSYREVDIRPMCIEQMRALGHAPFGLALEGETTESLTEKLRHLPTDRRSDLVFENVQARVPTTPTT
jgi:NAD+ synthase (glutamine-hydrolysing)